MSIASRCAAVSTRGRWSVPSRPLGRNLTAAGCDPPAPAALSLDRSASLDRAGQLPTWGQLGTLDALLALMLAASCVAPAATTPPRPRRYRAGIGGSTSNIVAGLLVVGAGYPVAFAAQRGAAMAPADPGGSRDAANRDIIVGNTPAGLTGWMADKWPTPADEVAKSGASSRWRLRLPAAHQAAARHERGSGDEATSTVAREPSTAAWPRRL
jgi:hypothetical protein